MKLKPPGRRLIRGLAASGLAVASVTGLVLSQTPATADPSITYLAEGANTTQWLMDQFASDVSGNLLGSFDAANPVTNAPGEIITAAKTGITDTASASGNIAPEQCSFTRPNGGTAAITALRQSLGSTNTNLVTQAGETVTVNGTTVTLPGVAPQPNCVDIGRATTSPSASVVDPTAGKLLYIPFALDAVTYDIGGAANSVPPPNGGSPVATPATNLTGATFTLAQLQAMYSAGTPETAGNGVTYAPFGGPDGLPSGDQPIDLYVPQAGAGTRTYWLQQMDGGTAPSTLPNWVFATIQSDGGATPSAFVGQTVEENNGTAVSADPNGIFPFAVSVYLAQAKGVAPSVIHSATQEPISGVFPTTGGAAGGGTLNTSFPLVREVYNVVAYDRVVNTGDGNYDPDLAGLFVGPNSQLCQDAFQITNFGFALLSSKTTNTCGQVVSSLRAYGPTTGF